MCKLPSSKFGGSVVYRRNCVLALFASTWSRKRKREQPNSHIYCAYSKNVGPTRVIVVSITVENNKNFGVGLESVRN